MDRFKLGVKKYGYDSQFVKEYQSLCAQLRHDEFDDFFNRWGIPNKNNENSDDWYKEWQTQITITNRMIADAENL